MNITAEARKRAEHFLKYEQQFHLGMLPTEQSNPKTRGLDEVFRNCVESGVARLFSVDEDIIPLARKIFAGREFALMLESSYRAVTAGGRIIFSGCGATGRLSILLESMWRTFFRKLMRDKPEIFRKLAAFENRVFSIMTGGDYALVKSVESFEDYPQFGERQARELGVSAGDVLIAITEGGETSSVLGTVAEAARAGAQVFLLFNNPAELLRRHIERSRQAIDNPAVTVLELYCGPMAVAGSTRMQATSSEQLVAGAMLEKLLNRLLRETLTAAELAFFPDSDLDYVAEMTRLAADLESAAALRTIAEYIRFEEQLYRDGGLVTYFVDEFLIDVFTDTTERSPTFMLPPFRKFDAAGQLPSPAFVKTPLFSTAAAWKYYLGREPRCLEWTSEDYRAMSAPEKIIAAPPAVSREEMFKFLIGNEPESCRFETSRNAAVSIFSGTEFNDAVFERTRNMTGDFGEHRLLIIGAAPDAPPAALVVPGTVKHTNLKLMEHLKIKLVLNAISTGTMICMGRVKSNWMSFVSMSNKKLVDRCIRLIAELAGLSYEDAGLALHQAVVELEKMDFSGREEPSPVQYTLDSLRKA
ncbi:MAG: hypothetical protein PHH77_08910 [Victivallaceae bacterium]|nr:hypothetical protein [Victivallaceae bacterium]